MFYCYLLTISSSFWAFVYDSAEKQMLNAISLVIEQRKNEFDRIAKVQFFPHLCLCLARVISLSGHLPRSIFSREGDITDTQNLLISFKSIICKLNYSHVIIQSIELFIYIQTCANVMQLKNRLWTTVALLHCCNLIWGLANDK